MRNCLKRNCHSMDDSQRINIYILTVCITLFCYLETSTQRLAIFPGFQLTNVWEPFGVEFNVQLLPAATKNSDTAHGSFFSAECRTSNLRLPVESWKNTESFHVYILICQTFLLCTNIMFTQLMALAGSSGSHSFYTYIFHNRGHQFDSAISKAWELS